MRRAAARCGLTCEAGGPERLGAGLVTEFPVREGDMRIKRALELRRIGARSIRILLA